MCDRPDSVGLSDEWRRRLDDLKEKAKVAEKGSIFFVEISSLPVVSLFIVTGDKINRLSSERETHLHFSSQPDTYPRAQDKVIAMQSIGYQHYLKECVDIERLDLSAFQTKFLSVCDDINNAIKKNHGVRCYEDGSQSNTHITNIIYLHICDILNMIINRVHNNQTRLVIKTKLLKKISDDLINDFEV